MSEKSNKTETAETSKPAEIGGASLSGLSRPSGLSKTDSPIATAIFAREAVRDGIARVYRALGRELPPKASLLELLSDMKLCEFIGDDDRLRDLEFVRILGINAEHKRKVKRTQKTFSL